MLAILNIHREQTVADICTCTFRLAEEIQSLIQQQEVFSLLQKCICGPCLTVYCCDPNIYDFFAVPLLLSHPCSCVLMVCTFVCMCMRARLYGHYRVGGIVNGMANDAAAFTQMLAPVQKGSKLYSKAPLEYSTAENSTVRYVSLRHKKLHRL